MSEYLEHHGVKGMKWGIRRNKSEYDPPYSKKKSKRNMERKHIKD